MKTWVTAHAAAQYEPINGFSPRSAGSTMRSEIAVPLSGSRVRVVLCERYGKQPVLYGRAVLGVGGKTYPLTFRSQAMALLLPGEALVSDALEVNITAGETLTLWLYCAGINASRSFTVMPALYSAQGDFCGRDFSRPPFMSETRAQRQNACAYARLEVETDDPRACAVAAFGDSITSMGLWVDPLAEKLKEQGETALLNMGIGGNRLLLDTSIPLVGSTQLFGRAALTRFSWDVAELPGVRVAILALGVNDISQPGGKRGRTPDAAQRCTPEALIAGFEKLVSLCKARSVKTVGCTITPFGGYLTYSETTARIRNEVNDWMLHGGAFDMVVDFAGAVCDPQKPDFMLAEFDSGDHLHPSPLGGQRMAGAVGLDALKALL